MRLKSVICVAIFSAGIPAALAGSAAAADLAADYLPPAPPAPDEPTELGTGWYLRGDAAFGPEDHPNLLGQGLAAHFDKKADAIGYGFGLGAGYQLNSFLRFDVTADYLDPFEYKSVDICGSFCSRTFQTNVWRWDGLANAYVDLGTWAGITPYIGAGAGFSGTHQDGSIGFDGGPALNPIVDPTTGALVTNGTLPSHTKYQFAWAGMAGFSYAFAPHILLDVSYRYLDLGKTTIPLYPITSVTKELTSQQVRVGIRYVID